MQVSRIIGTITLVALGGLLTTKAHGNLVLPSLAEIASFSVKTILPLLVVVTIIEATVLKIYLPTLKWLNALKAAAFSNAISTLIGIPLAPIMYLIVELIATVLPQVFNFHLIGALLFYFLWFAGCLVISGIIEESINKTILVPTISARNVQNATWLANVISYTFLYIFTIANHISK
jgi:hypothetical protein